METSLAVRFLSGGMNIVLVLALAPFFEKHPGAILDGEFYNHEFKNDFNEIVSLVKKSKPSEQDVAKVAGKTCHAQ